MIAVFFKNHKAEPSEQDLLLQQKGQMAMQERMVRMLRNDAKLAWMPPPAHGPLETGVKKYFADRLALASAH